MYRCICIVLCFSICTTGRITLVHSTIILWFFSPYSPIPLSYSLVVPVDMVSQNLNALSFGYTAGSMVAFSQITHNRVGEEGPGIHHDRLQLKSITLLSTMALIHHQILPIGESPSYLIHNTSQTMLSVISMTRSKFNNLLSLVTSCICINIYTTLFHLPDPSSRHCRPGQRHVTARQRLIVIS